MRAVFIAIAFTALPTVVLAQEQDVYKWASENVEENGWHFLATGKNVAIYVRDDKHRKPNIHTIWTRYEYMPGTITPFSAGINIMSKVSLEEYDCSGKSRMRTATLYNKNNMQSVSFSLNETGKWQYVLPGSLSETIEESACGPTDAELAKRLHLPPQAELDKAFGVHRHKRNPTSDSSASH